MKRKTSEKFSAAAAANVEAAKGAFERLREMGARAEKKRAQQRTADTAEGRRTPQIERRLADQTVWQRLRVFHAEVEALVAGLPHESAPDWHALRNEAECRAEELGLFGDAARAELAVDRYTEFVNRLDAWIHGVEFAWNLWFTSVQTERGESNGEANDKTDEGRGESSGS